MEGEGSDMIIRFGLVRDGTAWDVGHVAKSSTTGWFMGSGSGSLWKWETAFLAVTIQLAKSSLAKS
jgi:hypothetical protein